MACFANVAFLESISQHLEMDLCETLTHDVYRSVIEHYEEIFSILAPKQFVGPKTTHFRWLRNSTAILRVTFLARNIIQTIENYKGFPPSSQNFTNFGPQTA